MRSTVCPWWVWTRPGVAELEVATLDVVPVDATAHAAVELDVYTEAVDSRHRPSVAVADLQVLVLAPMVIEAKDHPVTLGQLHLADHILFAQLAVSAPMVAHELVCQLGHRVRRHHERRLVDADLADVSGVGGDGLLDGGVVRDSVVLLLVGDVRVHVAGVQAPERGRSSGSRWRTISLSASPPRRSWTPWSSPPARTDCNCRLSRNSISFAPASAAYRSRRAAGRLPAIPISSATRTSFQRSCRSPRSSLRSSESSV